MRRLAAVVRRQELAEREVEPQHAHDQQKQSQIIEVYVAQVVVQFVDPADDRHGHNQGGDAGKDGPHDKKRTEDGAVPHGLHRHGKNEADNGLKNNLGTVAMARTNDINSATAQFFINVKNNDFLNHQGQAQFGYAVFGKVVSGMDVVEAIKAVKTTNSAGMDDVPAEPVIIKSVTVVAQEN